MTNFKVIRRCLLATLLLVSLALAQQTCSSGSKYPKFLQEPTADEQVEAILSAESIEAVFVGGRAMDASGEATAFLMRIDADID